MKIDSVRKIAAILRTIAPEFKDKTDDDLRIWIELAEPYLSEGKYGKPDFTGLTTANVPFAIYLSTTGFFSYPSGTFCVSPGKMLVSLMPMIFDLDRTGGTVSQ